MGMFDTIGVPHNCYNCGTPRDDYQTKALDSLMDYYQLGDTIRPLEDSREVPSSFEIHDSCRNCNTRIEGIAYVVDGLLTKIAEHRGDREIVVAEHTPSSVK